MTSKLLLRKPNKSKFMVTTSPAVEKILSDGILHVPKIISPVSFQIPSRKYFPDKVIPSMYQATRIKLQEELDKQVLIAITTDAWKSRAVENYTAVTAHYITDDWKLKSSILEK